jgi:hypothetical protein
VEADARVSSACERRALERGADDGDGGLQIAEHELGGEPHDAVAGALEAAVPARIRPALGWAAVVRAVHLHDEPARRSEEVRDAARDQSLATEADAELRGPMRLPQRVLFGDALRRVREFGGVNVVIALDRADAENGGFEVLGRTHHGALLDTVYDTSAMNGGLFDESHRTLVPLSPGDAILFHPRLGHGSGPNLCERPRRLITLWFGGGAPG